MSGTLPPVGHTPLVALPVLILDLETTGLKVSSDRIVQIGVVAMEGPRLLETPRLDLLVNPGIPIPETSTGVHGLTDSAVAQAPPFADLAEQLASLMAERVVVGHHIAFDLAVLRHEAARAAIPWQEPMQLDVGHLFGALQPGLPDLALETVADSLGVTIERRHDAMGDCLATAEIWSRLVTVLRERDIRTFAEAQSFAARRDDIRRHEQEAGWHVRPGDFPRPTDQPPGLRIECYAFQGRLADHMKAPPVMAPLETPIRTAARRMVEKRIGALLVGDEGEPPLGIVTERDLLRVTAEGELDVDKTPLSEVMSTPVEAMSGDDMLYRALGRMDRLAIRHICLVDDAGRAIGMISQRDLLDHRARGVVVLDDALAKAEDLTSLCAAYARVPEVASELLVGGLGGVAIARFISRELQSLTARAADLAIERLAAEGKGDPPAPWCILVLGSGGRGESLLGADQDNALIHSGSKEDDAWFAALGEHVAELLDSAGVPLCKGGVMIKNPQWRGTLADWRQRIDGWLVKARPEDLLNVDIFFDLVPVAGEVELARSLRRQALEAASTTPPFLGLLAESVSGMAPRLGLFGGLPSEGGRVDLKRDGLLPLVSMARTLALKAASQARATPERLRDAAQFGNLPEGDATALISLHDEVLGVILKQQLLDLREGVRPSNRVVWKALDRPQQKRLTEGLRRLDSVVREVPAAMSR